MSHVGWRQPSVVGAAAAVSDVRARSAAAIRAPPISVLAMIGALNKQALVCIRRFQVDIYLISSWTRARFTLLLIVATQPSIFYYF